MQCPGESVFFQPPCIILRDRSGPTNAGNFAGLDRSPRKMAVVRGKWPFFGKNESFGNKRNTATEETTGVLEPSQRVQQVIPTCRSPPSPPFRRETTQQPQKGILPRFQLVSAVRSGRENKTRPTQHVASTQQSNSWTNTAARRAQRDVSPNMTNDTIPSHATKHFTTRQFSTLVSLLKPP